MWKLPLRQTFRARSLVVSNTADPSEKHLTSMSTWSVIAKQQEQKTPLYDPTNLPQHIPTEKIAGLTDQGRLLLERGT